MTQLCKALKDKDEIAFHHWTKTEEWATVQQIVAAQGLYTKSFFRLESK